MDRESKKEKGMFVSLNKKVKSHIVFTSFVYRIVVYLLLPAALTALCVWVGAYVGDMGLLLAATLLTVSEVVSDSWLFGGLQARDAEKMDYLKASGRGLSLVRDALAVDLLRKFLTALCTITASWLLIWLVKGGLERVPGTVVDFVSRGGALQRIGLLAYLVLLTFCFSVLGTFLSRYGSTIYGNLLLGYGAMSLVGLAGILGPLFVEYPSNGIFLLDLLCLAAGMGVSVLAVRAAMRKVEGGYYDE